MRPAILVAAAALTLLPLQASAQSGSPEPPADVVRVGAALRAYTEALLSPAPSPLLRNVDAAFNAPPAEVQNIIANARASIAAERSRLGALPTPNLIGHDINLTFIAIQLQADAIGRLEHDAATIEGAAAMFDAQTGGDCAALQQRTDEHRNLQRSGGSIAFNEYQALRSVLSIFAGQPGPPIPVSVEPPASHPDRIRATIADTIAKSLRCPMLGPDARADFVVQLAVDGSMTTTTSNVSPSALRDTVVERLANVRFPSPAVLRNSPLVGQPMRFTLANQRVSPAS